MRFETFEPRFVFDQSLGAAVELDLVAPADATPETPLLPDDIQFRSTSEDFNYSSDNVDPNTLDELVAATESWAEDPRPIRTFNFTDDDTWRKLINHNPISIHPDGYIVAERIAAQADVHSLLVVQKPYSECHTLGGTYTRPDHHYVFSFDVRHPESELSWLTTVEGHWSIVTELWGPRSSGPNALNPPFSIHTSVRNGVPYWAISNRGDSRLDTVRPYEEERFQYVPMTNVGDWHRWDIEYVPSHDGSGLARAWLDGELAVDWVDVKSSYLAYINDQIVGPLNPAIGLYSYNPADGQEAHFDNITMQCTGVFESSVSGRVVGTDNLAGNVVFATNQETGERIGVETSKSGVYTLAIPRGEYTITAVNQETGHQVVVENVSTNEVSSRIVDLDVTAILAPPPSLVKTFSGDVTGDGVADIVNWMDDNTWHVSSVDANGTGTTEIWASWSPGTQWQDVMMADFNGDEIMDIVGRADNGSWWVGESTGTNFRNVNWGKWTPTIEWLNVSIGDFNGDGRSDILGRAATNGSWWIAESSGDQFSNSSWGRWTTFVDWEVVVGDYNGDGLSDIAGRASSDGTWWVGASTGSRFQNTYWGKFTNNIGWTDFQVGDFNGDGRTDLVARAESDGTWWVAESDGNRFLNRHFGGWMNNISWANIQITDINGDGKSDVVGRASTDNSWWVARSTGERFENQYWGATWAQNVDWIVAIADDFDGDGSADLLGANADNWWLSR